MDLEGRLDRVDWQILAELQQNARMSFSELGRRVGLTSPAVAERVRRMEEAAIIAGYRVQLNLEKVGRSLRAMIRIALASNCNDSLFRNTIRELPEVMECIRITGDDCYAMQVAVGSSEQLEAFINRLAQYGKTTTCIVLSAPVTHRVVTPLEPTEDAADGKQSRQLRALP